MNVLTTIGLVILGIIIVIGIIRTIIEPTKSVFIFLIQLMLLDWLTDGLAWVIEKILENY